jgi:hypothetical protein
MLILKARKPHSDCGRQACNILERFTKASLPQKDDRHLLAQGWPQLLHSLQQQIRAFPWHQLARKQENDLLIGQIQRLACTCTMPLPITLFYLKYTRIDAIG